MGCLTGHAETSIQISLEIIYLWPARSTNLRYALPAITAKISNISSSEGKPECLRCLKYGTICGGYRSDIKYLNVTRPLLPSQNYTTTLRPSGVCFATEMEYLYFSAFRADLVPELAGVLSGSTIWERIILHACHAESFVREAVVREAVVALMVYIFSSLPFHLLVEMCSSRLVSNEINTDSRFTRLSKNHSQAATLNLHPSAITISRCPSTARPSAI